MRRAGARKQERRRGKMEPKADEGKRDREREAEKGWRQVGRDVCGDPDNRVGKQDDAPAPREVFFCYRIKERWGEQPRVEEGGRKKDGVGKGKAEREGTGRKVMNQAGKQIAERRRHERGTGKRCDYITPVV